jgi:hypothetical protein
MVSDQKRKSDPHQEKNAGVHSTVAPAKQIAHLEAMASTIREDLKEARARGPQGFADVPPGQDR